MSVTNLISNFKYQMLTPSAAKLKLFDLTEFV